MKKIIVSILLIGLLFTTFSSCNGETEEKTDDVVGNSEATNDTTKNKIEESLENTITIPTTTEETTEYDQNEKNVVTKSAVEKPKTTKPKTTKPKTTKPTTTKANTTKPTTTEKPIEVKPTASIKFEDITPYLYAEKYYFQKWQEQGYSEEEIALFYEQNFCPIQKDYFWTCSDYTFHIRDQWYSRLGAPIEKHTFTKRPISDITMKEYRDGVSYSWDYDAIGRIIWKKPYWDCEYNGPEDYRCPNCEELLVRFIQTGDESYFIFHDGCEHHLYNKYDVY